MSSRRIVIVGGGFGGVTLAQRLEKLVPAGVEIVLLSDSNHFVFTPLLAEAAGREISPLHVVVPGRQMVRRAQWLTAQVTGIDRGANLVRYVSRGGEPGQLHYDHLALACGSVPDFSAVPGLAAHAYPLRTLGDAVFLSNDLIGRLEEAAVHPDPEERRRLLTVAVIGGGFSGVEIAGALNDLIGRSRRFFPELAAIQPRLVLLQRGPRIVPELESVSLSEYALQKLRARHVDVRLNTGAREVTAREVLTTTGESIPAGTVICTVGNGPNPLLRTLNLLLDKGRLKTGPDMRVEGCEDVWALGDAAVVPNAWTGKPSLPTAQFATRQAALLAKNLDAVLRGKPPAPFSFKPLGLMAAIGRHNAVAELMGVRVSGFPAWILWRSVYLAKMPSMVRKLEVALDWTRSLLFPPNVVQLQLGRTLNVGRAHFAAGDFLFRRGDGGRHFYIIESGRAGVYIGGSSSPAATLGPGDHCGEVAESSARQPFSVKAETAVDAVIIGANDFRRLTDSLAVLKRDIRGSLAAQRGYLSFHDLAQKEPELLDHRVSRWMTRPAETLSPETTLEEAVNRFHGGRAGYPVASSEGRLAGYCGRTQLYDALRALLPPHTPVREFLLSDPPSVLECERLSDVLHRFSQAYVEVLPVLAADGSGRVVGVLSPIEIFRERIRAAAARQQILDGEALHQ